MPLPVTNNKHRSVQSGQMVFAFCCLASRALHTSFGPIPVAQPENNCSSKYNILSYYPSFAYFFPRSFIICIWLTLWRRYPHRNHAYQTSVLHGAMCVQACLLLRLICLQFVSCSHYAEMEQTVNWFAGLRQGMCKINYCHIHYYNCRSTGGN